MPSLSHEAIDRIDSRHQVQPSPHDTIEVWQNAGARSFAFAGMTEEGETILRKSSGARNQRLAEIKKRYDPDSVFRLNPNITPAR